MSRLLLTKMTKTAVNFEIYFSETKNFPPFLKSQELSEDFEVFLGQKVQVWQNFWRTVGRIVKIEKCQSGFKSKNLEDSEKNSESLKTFPNSNKISSKNKLKIECSGDFENCSSQNLWNFANDDFISPKIWENMAENSDQKSENNSENNSEKMLNLQNQRNESLENNLELKRYNFIPTVQNNERVFAGQKLGFVENNGNLFWLIAPNNEPKYQVKITSGEFEISEIIGELIGVKKYELSLKQNLNFEPLKMRKVEEMWKTGLLFDLFCPILFGSRNFLSGFTKNNVSDLIFSLQSNNEQIIFVTDFEIAVQNVNIFSSENCLELSQYFVLCGFQVILILQREIDWQQTRNFFGNFLTPSEEMASLTLFYLDSNTKIEKTNHWNLSESFQNYSQNTLSKNNSKNNSEVNLKHSSTLPFFHNFWSILQIKNLETSQKNSQNKLKTLPDILNSWTKNNFAEILEKKLNQQNSILVNQGNHKNDSKIPQKPTNLEMEKYLENPLFQLLWETNGEIGGEMKNEKNSQNSDKNLDKIANLWNFWLWLDENLEVESSSEINLELENLIKKIQKNQITPKKAKEEIENWQK